MGETPRSRIVVQPRPVDKAVDDRISGVVYTAPPVPRRRGICVLRPPFACEAHLPTERSSSQASARFPCAHGDPRRPHDHQAAPSEGPHPPVGVKRPNRLSRSRDFEAVYRHGRSVSSRFLVLYWFPQEDPGAPRFGLSVPRAVGSAVDRNRLKRQLRELWRERIDRVETGCDYVLIVRPGVSEGVAANGFEWLGERIDELLAMTKAAA
jgi:ribonuclease P protein component